MFISHISQITKGIEDTIPAIGIPLTKNIISHDENYLLATIAMRGIPFEAIDDDLLKTHFLKINKIVAQLGKNNGSRLALWFHTVHEKINFEQQYEFHNSFTRQFSQKYLQRFKDKKYFENSFYITLCYKFSDAISDAIRHMEELISFTHDSFIEYEPKILSIYEELSPQAKEDLPALLQQYGVNGVSVNEFSAMMRYSLDDLIDHDYHNQLKAIYELLDAEGKIIAYSETLEFYGFLVNGKRDKVPLSAERAYLTLPKADLHWFYNYLHAQYENDQDAFFTTYDLKGTPAKTKRGQFNQILTLPFEFVLTQSFYCVPIYAAQKLITDQLNKLESVQDKATKQIDELNLAQSLLAAGELCFGDYHAALVVKGDTYKQAIDNGITATTTLLGSSGTSWVKSKLSSPLTWLSQIPTYKTRPRSYPKPSTTIASTFSMHNYSTGKATGNPIGDGSAIMPLQTLANSLYSLNLHYSRIGENNTGEKIAGHLLMFGATGVGKTATQSSIIAMLERFNPKIFAIDKDRGMEIFIRGLKGTYFPLNAGELTGLAPFQLLDTKENREFLYGLVTVCGKDYNGKVTAEEEAQLKMAVDTIYTLPRPDRRFSRLLETIPNEGGDGLYARLSKWCEAAGGRFSWALDNETSILDLDNLTSISRIGFDVTDFLVKDYEATEPVLAFLFHLKKLMQKKGGLLATIIEECWLPAQYPITQAAILDVLKTGRKRDEFALLISQSPADVIKCPIFEAIVEQTPTKIYLPNPAAKYKDNYDLCNLTVKEFEAFKQLTEQSRTFLVKQGNQSCFATLNLHGMDDELAVISGSSDNVAVLEDVLKELDTNDPDVWMPIFQKRRKGKRHAA